MFVFFRLLIIAITFLVTDHLSLNRPAARFSPPPTVSVDSGVLQGTYFGETQDGVAFLGIPYAAPPVGSLRWKPPQPVSAWTGARKATEFGAACPQIPASWLPQIPWNEDCLYLNVWTTQFCAKAKSPVILYLHGGSNTAGFSQMTPLGPALSRLGVVIVSANYRLGPFGFLAHPALTAESDHHSSGNYGLLDQLQALKWIHNNVAQFGGDPARVTVMGQSAGAVDICLLMSSPLAQGLFEAAILESGECQSTLNEDIRTQQHYNLISGTGEEMGERLANDLRVPNSPNALQKLRSISAAAILKTWSKDRQVHFDAIVDGWIIPEQPAKIFEQGRELRIPILIGSNADEATVFGHGGPKTIEEYKKYLLQDTGNFADLEFQAYPVSSDADVPVRYLQLQNDTFAYGAYSMAQSITNTSQKAYLFYFTYAESGKRAPLGAYHGEELWFLSDSFPNGWERSQDDEALGNAIRLYWTQFAKTQNPNSRSLLNWQAYDARTAQRLELGRTIRVNRIPAQLQTLQGIVQRILNTSNTLPQ